jgi:TPR repeat protein
MRSVVIILLLSFSLLHAKIGSCPLDKDKQSYIACLKKEAIQTDSSEDINFLAAFYTLEKEYEKAIEWYKKSADKGSAKAAFFLGGIYDEAYAKKEVKKGLFGYLSKEDEKLLSYQKEAIKWYKIAAKAEYPDAMPHLNEMMEKVYGQEETIKRYKEAIEKKVDLYWNLQFLANFYFRLGEYEKRISTLEAFILEYPEEKSKWLFGIGNTYMEQFLNNKEKEIEYYRQAAALGNTMAMRNLGIYHGDKQEYDIAAEWFRKSDDPGMVCYMYIEKVRDKEKALECYKEVAKSGEAVDLFSVGYAYYYDLEDVEQGIYWYIKAYEAGSSDAALGLGSLYDDINEPEKSIEWYKKAAAMGQEGAIRRLKRLGEFQ